MTDGRNNLVKFVLDNGHSPMAILGAAVSFVRASSSEGRRIADAVDVAIRNEIGAIASERREQRLNR